MLTSGPVVVFMMIPRFNQVNRLRKGMSDIFRSSLRLFITNYYLLFENAWKCFKDKIRYVVVIYIFKHLPNLDSQSIWWIVFTKLYVRVYLGGCFLPQSFQSSCSALVETLWTAVDYTVILTEHFIQISSSSDDGIKNISPSMFLLVSGKCPREKSPPEKWPRENCLPENYPQKKAPQENCPPEKCPTGKLSTEKLPPREIVSLDFCCF